MTCKKCESQLKPNSLFCPVCGTRTDVEDTTYSTETPVVPPITQNQLSSDENNTSSGFVAESIQDEAVSADAVSPQGPKRKKGLIITISIILLLGILGVTGYFLGWFKSPNERMQDAINEQIDSIAEDLAESIDKIKTSQNTLDKTSSNDITVTLSDEAQAEVIEIIRQNSDDTTADLLSWIKEINCDSTMTFDGNLIAGDFFIRANGEDITPANLVVDINEEMLYITLPEINPTAISTKIDPSTAEAIRQLVKNRELTAQRLNIIPEKAVTKEFIAKYLKIMLAGVSDVESSDSPYDANGLSPDATGYNFKLSAATLASNSQKALTELKSDETVKKVLSETESQYEMNNLHEDFTKAIDSMLEDTNEEEFKEEFGDYIGFTIWIDDDDNFLGIRTFTDKKLLDLTYTTALVDNTYGSAVKLDVDNVTCDIKTKGSIAGGKFSGSTDFTVLGQTITLQYSDFDVDKYNNNLTSGTYTIEPPAHLLQMLKLLKNPNTKPFEDISKLVLNYDQKSDTDSDLSLTIDKNDKFYCTVGLNSSVQDKKEISIPQDVTSSDSMLLWTAKANIKTVTDNLEKAGFPYSFLDLLKMLMF